MNNEPKNNTVKQKLSPLLKNLLLLLLGVILFAVWLAANVLGGVLIVSNPYAAISVIGGAASLALLLALVAMFILWRKA